MCNDKFYSKWEKMPLIVDIKKRVEIFSSTVNIENLSVQWKMIDEKHGSDPHYSLQQNDWFPSFYAYNLN